MRCIIDALITYNLVCGISNVSRVFNSYLRGVNNNKRYYLSWCGIIIRKFITTNTKIKYSKLHLPFYEYAHVHQTHSDHVFAFVGYGITYMEYVSRKGHYHLESFWPTKNMCT
jgi:hypothetical protein